MTKLKLGIGNVKIVIFFIFQISFLTIENFLFQKLIKIVYRSFNVKLNSPVPRLEINLKRVISLCLKNVEHKNSRHTNFSVGEMNNFFTFFVKKKSFRCYNIITFKVLKLSFFEIALLIRYFQTADYTCTKAFKTL